jgi:tetratricopeptide (TPR) repeat protein
MMLEPGAASARRISVAIVCHDDQHALAQTLATARVIADEIVVVDCGSQGKMNKLAGTLNLAVVERPWQRDFSVLRNAALERATGDWLLWLEPGESMPPDAALALRQFAQSAADLNNVYLLVVTVPPAPGEISGEQVAQIRLLPHTGRLHYRGRVRERLEPSPEALGLGSEGLAWRIARGGRENETPYRTARANRDLELVELDLAERGMRPCLLVARGEALAGLHDRSGAARAFREAIAVAPPTSSAQREAYYGLLTTCIDPAQRPEQVQICLEALEKFPLDAQLLCAMGGYMQAEGQSELSAQAYRTAVDFGQIDPQTWHVPDIHEIAAICLSLTFQMRGNDDECRQVLEQMLARRPESQRVRRHLIDLHVCSDRRKEALAEFDKLPTDTPYREALRSAIRGACLAAKRNWVPAAAYLQTAYSAGCRDLLCLRWLSLTLMSTGQDAAALPVLQAWKTLDPRSAEAARYLDALESAEAKPELVPQPGTAIPPGGSRRLRVDAPSQVIGAALPPLKLSAGESVHTG